MAHQSMWEDMFGDFATVHDGTTASDLPHLEFTLPEDQESQDDEWHMSGYESESDSQWSQDAAHWDSDSEWSVAYSDSEYFWSIADSETSDALSEDRESLVGYDHLNSSSSLRTAPVASSGSSSVTNVQEQVEDMKRLYQMFNRDWVAYRDRHITSPHRTKYLKLEAASRRRSARLEDQSRFIRSKRSSKIIGCLSNRVGMYFERKRIHARERAALAEALAEINREYVAVQRGSRTSLYNVLREGALERTHDSVLGRIMYREFARAESGAYGPFLPIEERLDVEPMYPEKRPLRRKWGAGTK